MIFLTWLHGKGGRVLESAALEAFGIPGLSPSEVCEIMDWKFVRHDGFRDLQEAVTYLVVIGEWNRYVREHLGGIKRA